MGVRDTAIMTLHIVEIRGRLLVEESRTQFRSAAAAELQGRARIADLENR